VLLHCRTGLTSYKLPRHVEFRDALPKNTGRQGPATRRAAGQSEKIAVTRFACVGHAASHSRIGFLQWRRGGPAFSRLSMLDVGARTRAGHMSHLHGDTAGHPKSGNQPRGQ